ncbi:MAG: sulfatase-like hydrolase/transferase, partial [Planctomycetes bacterium]|nr:sulfatase-like hydrolase/transferase [Planctomycetota bacterium]
MSLESAQKFFRLHGIACILLVFAGCGPPVKKPANVLLVVVDTLRQDHLGVYGYSVHPTSPHLDQFAQESFTMHGLTGVSSWTMPSVATLFTGLTPKEHGVMRMVGEESRLLRGQTLAERFSEAGFQTACIQSNFLLRSQRGVRFDRGFHHWDDSPAATPDPHRGSSAKVVADKGLEWLEQTSAESPWFLTLHFFDPHSSYEDHEELHFEHSDYQGWVTGGASIDVRREHGASSPPTARNHLAAYYDDEI